MSKNRINRGHIPEEEEKEEEEEEEEEGRRRRRRRLVVNFPADSVQLPVS